MGRAFELSLGASQKADLHPAVKLRRSRPSLLLPPRLYFRPLRFGASACGELLADFFCSRSGECG